MMYYARVCDYCEVDWPINQEYTRCPLCAGETDLVQGIQPIGQAQAKQFIIERAASIKKRKEFDAWYEARELEKFRRELENQDDNPALLS